MGEKLNVLIEPDNRVGKFAGFSEKDQTVVAHLKGETLESSQRQFYTSSEAIPTETVMLKFQGSDAN